MSVGILCKILSVPHNTSLDLKNVMLGNNKAPINLQNRNVARVSKWADTIKTIELVFEGKVEVNFK